MRPIKVHGGIHRRIYSPGHKHFALRRDLGLFQATAAGVGIILGAGIYALIGIAAGSAGNALWLSFLLAAVTASFTGLSYAELSSVFSKDASEYVYANNAFGKRLAFLAGWLVIASGVVMGATVSLGFADYFTSLFGGPALIVALCAIAGLSLINFSGIKESSWFNVVGTLVEGGGLVFIILIGLGHIGSVDYLEMPQGFGGVLGAAALIFFAFIGFESIVKLSEETKSARKTIPTALVLSLIISTVLYVLVAISAVSVLGWQELSVSKAPLADVAAVALGPDTFVVLSIVALFSTANTILLSFVAASRGLYGMAELGAMPKALAKIHVGRRTPYIAISIVGLVALAFSAIGNMELIANITNFAIFVTFVIVNLSLIHLRLKKPGLTPGFRAPLNIGNFPVFALLGAALCFLMIFNLPLVVIAGGLVLISIGLCADWLVRRARK